MSVKVTVEKDEEESGIDYPCLMIADDGDIALMSSSDTGVIVRYVSSTGIKVGCYSCTWATDVWRPFTGKLIMENEQ